MSTLTSLSVIPRRIALVSILLWCSGAVQAAGPTGLLNDTGQTQCDNSSNVLAACGAANTGDAAAMPRQDGRFGRDAASPVKVGGGAAGFDFSKVCFNGDVQGSGTCTGALVANTTGTATGTASTDWACTKDNLTNLIWSLQTQTATWKAASAGTYPDAGHNAASRCGFNTGWRLPTRRELFGIVHNGLVTAPMIDSNYFPSTVSDRYWSSETYAPNTSNAGDVYFNRGDASVDAKTNTTMFSSCEADPDVVHFMFS